MELAALETLVSGVLPQEIFGHLGRILVWGLYM